jgi:transposase InsO family protein
MGIEEVLSAPRSPWQRAYVERIIGSIRRECLDHVIVLGEGSLRRTLVARTAARTAETCRPPEARQVRSTRFFRSKVRL